MSVYVDSSALLKVYLDEPETRVASSLLEGKRWITGRHTLVEVRRNLNRLLDNAPLDSARVRFASDWEELDAVTLGARATELAASFAELTGLRTLDALHLGAAELAGGGDLPFVTFDRRLAGAARALGWEVLPA